MNKSRSRQEWNVLFERWQKSKLSAKEFCTKNNLHPKTFQNRFRESSFYKKPKHQKVPMTPTKRRPVSQTAFVELTHASASPNDFEIHVGLIRIQPPSDCSIDLFTTLVARLHRQLTNEC